MDFRLLGEQVKARRVELDLQQEQLAELAHLSGAYISRLERGMVANPKIGDLERLASALGWALDYLIQRGR
jgi:transcriptional regulator with XRE-family HTH domain